jgi:hypothetical protein
VCRLSEHGHVVTGTGVGSRMWDPSTFEFPLKEWRMAAGHRQQVAVPDETSRHSTYSVGPRSSRAAVRISPGWA